MEYFWSVCFFRSIYIQPINLIIYLATEASRITVRAWQEASKDNGRHKCYATGRLVWRCRWSQQFVLGNIVFIFYIYCVRCYRIPPSKFLQWSNRNSQIVVRLHDCIFIYASDCILSKRSPQQYKLAYIGELMEVLSLYLHGMLLERLVVLW